MIKFFDADVDSSRVLLEYFNFTEAVSMFGVCVSISRAVKLLLASVCRSGPCEWDVFTPEFLVSKSRRSLSPLSHGVPCTWFDLAPLTSLIQIFQNLGANTSWEFLITDETMATVVGNSTGGSSPDGTKVNIATLLDSVMDRIVELGSVQILEFVLDRAYGFCCPRKIEVALEVMLGKSLHVHQWDLVRYLIHTKNVQISSKTYYLFLSFLPPYPSPFAAFLPSYPSQFAALISVPFSICCFLTFVPFSICCSYLCILLNLLLSYLRTLLNLLLLPLYPSQFAAFLPLHLFAFL
jgi:hypothetical protein